MGLANALELLRTLEEPVDANARGEQWRLLRCWDSEVGTVRSLFELTPEPADSVAFQFYVSVPEELFVRCFQGALTIKMDGRLLNHRPILAALQKFNGQGWRLSDKLLIIQHWHYYLMGDSPHRDGLLARVEKTREWLKRSS